MERQRRSSRTSSVRQPAAQSISSSARKAARNRVRPGASTATRPAPDARRAERAPHRAAMTNRPGSETKEDPVKGETNTNEATRVAGAEKQSGAEPAVVVGNSQGERVRTKVNA